MFTVVSTRFNNETFQENINYREKKQMDINACIYCSPQPMSPKILPESLVFVVEMNNSTNQIEGIGLIKNVLVTDIYNVYDTRNFNRYIFKGDYRINRDELIRKDEKIIEILDYILFKEKTHMKRGAGFTKIPEKLWKHTKCESIDIPGWIRKEFIEKFAKIKEL
jgi:hypothetical protein